MPPTPKIARLAPAGRHRSVTLSADTILPLCQAIHARTDGQFLGDLWLAKIPFSIRDHRTVETA